MTDAEGVVQSIAFETTNRIEHPVEIPEDAPHGWPAGTRPMAVAWDDDDVQVMLDFNVWHRQAVGLPETACGLAINYRNSLGIRGSSYLGRLCKDGCFSRYELDAIAPRLTAQHEREEEAGIQKILERTRQNVIDGETRRRKKTDK